MSVRKAIAFLEQKNQFPNSKIETLLANFLQKLEGLDLENRPFSYSTKEPGSSDIFIQLFSRGSIEWR